jgi:hypothetical protein
MRRLNETLRSVADAIAAGVGNLPTKRSPPRGPEVSRHGGTLIVQNGL